MSGNLEQKEQVLKKKAEDLGIKLAFVNLEKEEDQLVECMGISKDYPAITNLRALVEEAKQQHHQQQRQKNGKNYPISPPIGDDDTLRVKRSHQGGGGEPALKRRILSGTDRFFACLPDGLLDSGQKTLRFLEIIADGDIKSIFQRHCFGPLKQKVEAVLSEKNENGTPKWSSAIITGTSGIGKTCFGFYLAHQLVKAGKVVAYNYRNKPRVVLAPSVSELQAKEVEDKATKEQATGTKKADKKTKAAEKEEDDKTKYLISLLDEYQQGQLAPMEGKEETDAQRNASQYWGTADKSSGIWTKLLEHEETWLLVDLHRGDKYEDGRQACKIVLTSTLRKGDWPNLDSGGGALSKKLYMSPLSLREAKKINTAVNLSIQEDELTRRFTAFGGSARFLFHAGAEQKVEEAFQSGLQTLLDPNTENPVQTSTLVHILADDNFGYVGRKWASQAIAVRAVDALIDSREAGERLWLEATQGKTGKRIMGARGIFAERLWHRAVQSDKKIRIKALLQGNTSAAVEVMTLDKSFHRTRRFSKADLSDLTKMALGECILPDNDQFPDVDAIAVLNHAPWKSVTDEEEASPSEDYKEASKAEESGDHGCIGIMLQMAIGDRHKRAQGQTLVDIDKKMAALIEGYTAGESGSPLLLIYVTESADGWSYHNYTTKLRKSYQPGTMPRVLNKIQQFAMSFPKLTD